jgi:hypothetical protein
MNREDVSTEAFNFWLFDIRSSPDESLPKRRNVPRALTSTPDTLSGLGRFEPEEVPFPCQPINF